MGSVLTCSLSLESETILLVSGEKEVRDYNEQMVTMILV